VPVEIADTPRGPMPHLHGRIPEDAVERLPLDAIDAQPDRITGTRIGFAAFAGMTLLDLIGPLDALSRIASMSFDPTTSSEVFALDDAAPIWSGSGLEVRALRRRPRLDAFDVLVVPGGFGTRTLVRDAGALAYLSTFPANRLLASVCTGALVLGAMGRLRGKPATTHASALDELTGYGATVRRERVVQADNVITAGGVTSGIDLGLALVARLTDAGVADAIARQMEVQSLQHSSATPLLA
jgi:transcriptional regulator GlxA family with amidase domain